MNDVMIERENGEMTFKPPALIAVGDPAVKWQKKTPSFSEPSQAVVILDDTEVQLWL